MVYSKEIGENKIKNDKIDDGDDEVIGWISYYNVRWTIGFSMTIAFS